MPMELRSDGLVITNGQRVVSVSFDPLGDDAYVAMFVGDDGVMTVVDSGRVRDKPQLNRLVIAAKSMA